MKDARLCILMSLTGGGHRSVAKVLASSATRLDGLEVSVRDPFGQGPASAVDRLLRMYAPIIVSYTPVWGLIYHGSDRARLFGALMRLAGLFQRHKLERLLDAERPDAIISVHPLCNHLALEAARAIGSRAPLITVVTELVTVHASWVAPGTAAYVAATERARDGLTAKGADPARVHVLGLPIDERFGRVQGDPARVRVQLGLRPDLPTVLLTGGGEGAGPILASIRAISAARMPLQLVVVCGRNRGLLHQVERMRSGVPITALGFVDNMPQLLFAADVVALKAGSVSVSEAIASHRPMVILQELPGQERGNARLVLENRLGARARTPRELVQALWPLIADPALRRELSENCAPLLRPGAATRVIDLARELSGVRTPVLLGI